MGVFQQELPAEWIDLYGHMSEVYYSAAAGTALWDLLERLGIGDTYFKETACGFYAAESHVRYLREIRAPATLETRILILGADAKRLHYGAIIAVDGIERATFESVLLHADTRTSRVIRMPEAALEALEALRVSEPPEWSGRSVSLKRR
jgi:acyl-CoA thioester hydrolase